MTLVKGNQPNLLADIRLLFQERQVVAETLTTTETVDLGHGRIEGRCLTASSALADYLDWPGLQQVFAIVRTTTASAPGKYGTKPSTASPACRHSAPMRLVYSAWSGSIGASKTNRIGCAT